MYTSETTFPRNDYTAIFFSYLIRIHDKFVLLDRRLFTIGISIMESLFGGIPALPRALRRVGLGPTGAGGDAMTLLTLFSGASTTPEDTVRFRDFFSGISLCTELCLTGSWACVEIFVIAELGGKVPAGASKGLLQ